MKIIPLFFDFMEKIFSIKIFEIELIDILIFFTVIIFSFKIILILGNSNINGSDKE